MTPVDGILVIVSCILILWVALFVERSKGLVWNLKKNWPPLLLMLAIAAVILGVGA